MHFLSIFTAGLALVSSAIALPTTLDQTTATNPLFERADCSATQNPKCPSVDTIVKWLKANTKVGKNTVFYTGSAKSQQAVNFAKTISGAQTFSTAFMGSTALQEKGYLTWLDECGQAACEQDLLIPRMSEALAKASTGVAYVMIKEGDTIDPKKIWSTAEYPALKANNVEVWAVNSETTDFTTHLQKKKYDGTTKFS